MRDASLDIIENKNENCKSSNQEDELTCDQQKISIKHFLSESRNKILHNINSWNCKYWLFYYAVVPSILLLIPQLPQDWINSLFIQNQSQLLSPSIYLNNFSHVNIVHLCSNLFAYLLAITLIFSLEENRKRLLLVTIISFTIVPLLGSILTWEIWEILHTVNGKNLGFSSITIAFFAYCLYLIARWLYKYYLLDTIIGKKEKEIFHAFLACLSKKSFTKNNFVISLLFLVEFAIFLFIINALVKFGYDSSQYVISNGAYINGIGHFQGFNLGFLSPAIYSLFTHENEQIFNLSLLILTIFGIWNYFYQYLAPNLYH